MNWIIQYFVCNIYYLILSYIFSFTWQNFPFITWEKSKWKSRKENPQKPTQLSSRSHPRHLVGKRKFKKFPWENFTMRFSKFPFCSFGIITELHVVWTFCSFETISGLYIEWQHLSNSMLHCPAREEFPGRGCSIGGGGGYYCRKTGAWHVYWGKCLNVLLTENVLFYKVSQKVSSQGH